MRSAGTRFIIVGLLALFMFIPLFFAGVIIGERGSLARSTAASLGQEWGGPQVLSGPELIIPVSETITTRTWRLQYDDQGNVLRGEDGKPLRRNEAVTKREDRAPLVLLPSRFDVTIDAQSDVRSRGIFDVPVYRAETEITFDFDTTGIALGDNMVIHWEQAALNFGLSSNRAL
ncbi:MAG: inner membrane CreD family protein, partial [Pseudomonadota bacterium]